MRKNSGGVWLAAALLLFALPALAADGGDGWGYPDSDADMAYPEPEPPTPVDNSCPHGVNHHDSPCDCPPIPPEVPVSPEESVGWEKPSVDAGELVDAFSGYLNAFVNFLNSASAMASQAANDCADSHDFPDWPESPTVDTSVQPYVEWIYPSTELPLYIGVESYFEYRLEAFYGFNFLNTSGWRGEFVSDESRYEWTFSNAVGEPDNTRCPAFFGNSGYASVAVTYKRAYKAKFSADRSCKRCSYQDATRVVGPLTAAAEKRAVCPVAVVKVTGITGTGADDLDKNDDGVHIFAASRKDGDAVFTATYEPHVPNDMKLWGVVVFSDGTYVSPSKAKIHLGTLNASGYPLSVSSGRSYAQARLHVFPEKPSTTPGTATIGENRLPDQSDEVTDWGNLWSFDAFFWARTRSKGLL